MARISTLCVTITLDDHSIYHCETLVFLSLSAIMPITRNQAAREAASSSNKPLRAAVRETDASNRVRHRNATDTHQKRETDHTKRSLRSTTSDDLPRFTIDLSSPPKQRYLELCAALQSEITGLTSLFDEVVAGMVPWMPIRWLHLICRVLLRGIFDQEENAELKGISKATSVPIYLLVCFNVLLDLFMGCSSGGAAIRDNKGGKKMVHFRTLDWDMPALRRIIVQLDFVTERGGPVVASSITYAGFVGVLTGVRKDFSVSLNFRPNRFDSGSPWPDAQYRWHLLLVLLGYRPSIASILRSYLVPQRAASLLSYEGIVKPCAAGKPQASMITSTACYLCFCSGRETTVVEKDRITARSRSHTEFIVVTNNDEQQQADRLRGPDAASEMASYQGVIAEIIEEAQERKQCAEQNWQNVISTRGSGALQGGQSMLMEIQDVVDLVQRYPTTNEMTHFACVMDPSEGTIHWCRRWKRPVSKKWMKEHS